MHPIWKILTLLVLVGVPVTAGTVLYSGLASSDMNIHHDGGVRGAPGPLVGAGVPSCGRLWSLLAHQTSSPQA